MMSELLVIAGLAGGTLGTAALMRLLIQAPVMHLEEDKDQVR
jgi:hypothetical protein